MIRIATKIDLMENFIGQATKSFEEKIDASYAGGALSARVGYVAVYGDYLAEYFVCFRI